MIEFHIRSVGRNLRGEDANLALLRVKIRSVRAYRAGLSVLFGAKSISANKTMNIPPAKIGISNPVRVFETPGVRFPAAVK
ncbi:MAG: hypothetical protein FWF10_08295 [Clostridiales bacterium]|nr:hypothetical protein [Clostridiales bacterium]